MISLLKRFPLFILLLSCLIDGVCQLDSTKFKHHYIANPLPGLPDYGTGAFTLADYDLDGDLDITISRQPDSTRCYWYQNQAGSWLQRFIGFTDIGQLGAATMDVNGDKYPDLIIGRIWFENPGESLKLHRPHRLSFYFLSYLTNYTGWFKVISRSLFENC